MTPSPSPPDSTTADAWFSSGPGLTPEDLEAITDRIISGLVEEATKPV